MTEIKTHAICPIDGTPLTIDKFDNLVFSCKTCLSDGRYGQYSDAWLQGYWVGFSKLNIGQVSSDKNFLWYMIGISIFLLVLDYIK